MATVASALLGILTSVLNTYFLPPDLFGDVKYVGNLISFCSGFLLLGYFVSGCRLIAIEKNERIIREFKGVLILILGITSLLLVGSVVILAGWNAFLGNRAMAIMFLVSIPVCASPLLQNYINTVLPGDNQIGMISFSRIAPSVLYLMVAFLVFRIWGATPVVMILLLHGSIVTVCLFVIASERPSFRHLRQRFRQLNVENRQYGIQVYWGSVCGVSLGYLAGITLGWFGKDNTEVGLFSLALAITGPLAMLPMIIGTVFFRRFANSNRIESRVIWFTLLLTSGSFLAFALLIHPLVSLLYSKDYASVAGYSIWLAGGACLNGIGDMFNRFLGAHAKGKELRNGAIMCGMILLVGNLAGVYFFGIQGAIQTRNLAYLVYCALMIYYYHSTVSVMEQTNR